MIRSTLSRKTSGDLHTANKNKYSLIKFLCQRSSLRIVPEKSIAGTL